MERSSDEPRKPYGIESFRVSKRLVLRLILLGSVARPSPSSVGSGRGLLGASSGSFTPVPGLPSTTSQPTPGRGRGRGLLAQFDDDDD